jgi:hypothetical protein
VAIPVEAKSPSLAPTNTSEVEETPSESDSGESHPTDPNEIKTNPNPLNPAGDSLDSLIKMRVNEDLWRSMLGDLPCLEAADECITKLQSLAIQNSRELKAIDERVEAIKQKVEEARKNNQKTVRLGVFEPLVQSWLTLENVPVQPGQSPKRRGILDRVFGLVSEPLSGINEILSLVGVPLFRNVTGGDAAAQSRAIAIGDLQVKLAEIENK